MNKSRCRERFSGILLHPTSLPGHSGIGDLGAPARQFVDFLSAAYQTLWQICPLGPTGYGDSPYAAFSAFAGNPLLIALEPLVEIGLLEQSELDAYPSFAADRVDYGPVIEAKGAILSVAAGRFSDRADADLQSAFGEFCNHNASWLDDYSLFRALKDANDGAVWNAWEKPLATRDPKALLKAARDMADEIDSYKVVQFLFFHQWAALKAYANSKEIRIIGDVPIFVAYDSADVWAHREFFHLDESGAATVVAGVPPDYFSHTGQLWGNPLYRWQAMKEDGYAWWMARLRMALTTADVLRLDHFRGFDAYWEVPAGEETAINGRWVRGPGADFFERAREELGDPLPLIAEDLGIITPRINALREQFGMSGMKVLQFAFGAPDPTNPYLPHNHSERCVVYTGTHDNETTRQWYENIDEATRDRVRRYLWSDGEAIHLDLTRYAFMSVANIAIIPLQDVLGLGGEARLNSPGAAEGNWQWRVAADRLNDVQAAGLRYLTDLYGRGPLPEDDTGEVGEDESFADPDNADEE